MVKEAKKRGRPPGTGGVQYWSDVAKSWQVRALTAEEACSSLIASSREESERADKLSSALKTLAAAIPLL
jgi:hypothetical protein